MPDAWLAFAFVMEVAAITPQSLRGQPLGLNSIIEDFCLSPTPGERGLPLWQICSLEAPAFRILVCVTPRLPCRDRFTLVILVVLLALGGSLVGLSVYGFIH